MAKNLSNLRAPRKANTGRKRVGRGMGSGMGKTSTRGHKGQGSRTGTSLMRGFEGGQMPLHRRLPKRGFTNIFRTEYTVVNLDRIAEHVEGLSVTEIGLDDYKKLGLASSKRALIKILGSGELASAITIHAHKFSKSAVEKIEKAGGKAVVLGAAPATAYVTRGPVFPVSSLLVKITEKSWPWSHTCDGPHIRQIAVSVCSMEIGNALRWNRSRDSRGGKRPEADNQTCLRSSLISSGFPTCASAYCSPLLFWPYIGWAAISPRLV